MTLMTPHAPVEPVSKPRDAFVLLKSLIEGYRQRQADPATAGPPLIDLSIGNPDLPPDPYWRERLCHHIGTDDQHGYAEFRPDINQRLRERFAAYYQRRFVADGAAALLDPRQHVLDLLGSKEGIFYSLFAALQAGDAVLMTDPSYTVYQSCARLVGARVEFFGCDSDGQPDLDSIRAEQLQRARVLVICSPSNPTGVTLSTAKLEAILRFAERHDLWVVIDRAYAEIAFDPPQGTLRPGAALTLPGAMERVIELHSLSKSCGLAGWRIGFAVGAPALIARMKTLKFNADFGTFLPLQQVAIEMLDRLEEIAARNSAVYAQRMRRFADGANALGWEIAPSHGTFFLWAKLPRALAESCDLAFVERALDETGILFAPGSGFGPAGAGYVRIALVHDVEVIEQALARLKSWFESLEKSVVVRAA